MQYDKKTVVNWISFIKGRTFLTIPFKFAIFSQILDSNRT